MTNDCFSAGTLALLPSGKDAAQISRVVHPHLHEPLCNSDQCTLYPSTSVLWMEGMYGTLFGVPQESADDTTPHASATWDVRPGTLKAP